MSRISSLGELQDAMQSEFAWRKKELHSIKTMVIANEATHNWALFVRAAITLLYAHWEGFIKKIGTFYLGYVAKRKLTHSELADHFLAVAVSGLVRNAKDDNAIQPCLELVSFFRSQLGTRSSINWRNGIRTRSNLNSSVFREIVSTLGLDYSRFATKEKLIDEQLLHTRNNVAHGQDLTMKCQEYLDLHDVVFGMMQDFYDQVENAALAKAYRAT